MSIRKRALKWRGDLEFLEHRQLLTLSLVANDIFPTQGILFSGTVATLFDGDPNAQASDFNVKIVWQDGQSTSGTVTPNGSIFDVEGSYTYPQAGSFNTQITVTDNNNQTASAQGLAQVSASGSRSWETRSRESRPRLLGMSSLPTSSIRTVLFRPSSTR